MIRNRYVDGNGDKFRCGEDYINLYGDGTIRVGTLVWDASNWTHSLIDHDKEGTPHWYPLYEKFIGHELTKSGNTRSAFVAFNLFPTALRLDTQQDGDV